MHDLIRPYVGIDPGAHGCIWAWMPSGLAPKRLLLNTGDARAVLGVCRRMEQLAGPALVALERNHPVPGMGAVSAFTFGRSYGTLTTALLASGLEVRVVSAQVWRKWALSGSVPKDRKARDAATVAEAMRRWADADWPKARRWREAQAAAMFMGAWLAAQEGEEV